MSGIMFRISFIACLRYIGMEDSALCSLDKAGSVVDCEGMDRLESRILT
jgi:hypothetical protein